ncbi:hypothetical protein SASPL_157492 [Salvia splendens]|uniref:SAM-dependent MTase RsmB/NOP-type domain-containing protein n=1 Tax=Salvia splendens TaxID=180675 RepID=A0A8X8YUX8_SALSN|nr:hypothetical protein SASPL_157492 [Salvia splendens]
MIHCNMELAERASRMLFELEPTNAGNYVLLAEIYAEAKMWDEVKGVGEKGLQKLVHALVVKLSEEMMEQGTCWRRNRANRQAAATPGMFPSGKLYDEISEPDQETANGQTCENSNGTDENGGKLIDDSVAPTSNVEQKVSDLPLERCMRIVPHDQNSGAFFIAVFQKLLPLPAPTTVQRKGTRGESQKQLNEVKEDKNGDDIDVSGEMMFKCLKQLLPPKKINEQEEKEENKTSDDKADAKTEALELNLLGGQQLKIAAVGLKMNAKLQKRGHLRRLFRISSEGLPLILPHITKQILYASPIDFKHLLQYKSIKFPDFVEPSLREKAAELILGCCVVILRAGWVQSGSGEDAMPIAMGELLERVLALRSDEASEPVADAVPIQESTNDVTIPEANGSDSTVMAPETS